ncbi:hypothetical protein J2D73_19210 [Acetobacter sacchari]|uniref:Uncharacterized protein n=1 Tax=Acetobacter sacchari TaxID=2661687 RepID=A0ABS3M1A3_9PROT|nr:hypothetical protein [Acetobacter sacchari]MBO1361915.1 hypothetical protein [Acetobacter sacchari]
MAVTIAAIQPGVTLGSSSTTIATGAGSTTTITTGIVANSSAAAITLAVSVARAAGGTFPVIVGRSVAAGSSALPPELASFVLKSGDTLTATGDGLSIILNGMVVS